jgi:hypothetical protein
VEANRKVNINELGFESWSRRTRVALVVAISLISFLGLCLAAPIPLGPSYHIFADNRTQLGIPNCLDVLSNIPFMVVGLWGILWLCRGASAGAFRTGLEKTVYFVFFLGVALTGVGSFWYHLNPNNQRLPFDLLPMTCAFMAILTSVAIERIGVRFGRSLFLPLLLLGCCSVGYWYVTEARGHGDYRFYLFVQFFPPILIGMMIVLFPPSYTGMKYLVAAFLLFVAAKVFELFDSQIYQAGYVVSGHALKHVTAGVACYSLLLMLQRRHAVTALAQGCVASG